MTEPKDLDILVAVHGFDIWRELAPEKLAAMDSILRQWGSESDPSHEVQIDPAKLALMDSALRRWGESNPAHEVQFPVLLVCPDERITLLDAEKGNTHPYVDGRKFDSLQEALDYHAEIAPQLGYKRGKPTVLTPEFRRYPTRGWEYRRFDRTDLYHEGPDLSERQRAYFKRETNQENASEIYVRFSEVYDAILKVAGLDIDHRHPQCYNLALEAAAEEGHFGETFIRGIRGMSMEIAMALNLDGRMEFEKNYDPAANITNLKRALEQKLGGEKPEGPFKVIAESVPRLQQLATQYLKLHVGEISSDS